MNLESGSCVEYKALDTMRTVKLSQNYCWERACVTQLKVIETNVLFIVMFGYYISVLCVVFVVDFTVKMVTPWQLRKMECMKFFL